MKKFFSRIILIGSFVLAVAANGTSQSSVVRLHTVIIPVDSGLFTALLPDFEMRTGYHVEVTKEEQVYDSARRGTADLVFSHYGHDQVDDFMADGLGLWPRIAFANQSVILGPPSDPAGIRGMQDAVEAFRKIAQTRSRFIVNNAVTEKYLGQMLWEAAGRPDPNGWYNDTGLKDQQAVQTAERSAGYVVMGVIPFLKFKEMTGSSLEMHVLDDPLLRRTMMAVIVNPEKVAGVNVAGALALQKYLTSPEIQGRIRAFRYPGVSQQLFWPESRDNIGAFLSDNSPLPTMTDPVVNGIVLNVSSARAGGNVTAAFTGGNLSNDTYFDVRFRTPGATSDEIALNWQQGTSSSHAIPLTSPSGTWRITGVRAHRDATDHAAAIIPVSASLSVGP